MMMTTNDLTCPHCNGAGTVKEYDDLDRYHLHTCHQCDGSGTLPHPRSAAWLTTPWPERSCGTEAVLEEVHKLKELLVLDLMHNADCMNDCVWCPSKATTDIIDQWLTINRMSVLDILDDALYAYLNDLKLK